MPTSYKEKLTAIKVFIFDIDGVLTDGSVYLFDQQVVRVLNSRDGFAIQHANKQGYLIFAITGGNSEEVKNRLLELGMKEVILKSSNKMDVYNALKNKYNFNDEEVLYMGDDLPDYHVLKQVGVSTCPQDAAVEIKSLVDYQSPFNGGRHCVRDVIEQTMRVQGKWSNSDSYIW